MAARSVSTARSASSLSLPFDCRAFTGRQSQRQHHNYEFAHGLVCASHTHLGEEAGKLIAALPAALSKQGAERGLVDDAVMDEMAGEPGNRSALPVDKVEGMGPRLVERQIEPGDHTFGPVEIAFALPGITPADKPRLCGRTGEQAQHPAPQVAVAAHE